MIDQSAPAPAGVSAVGPDLSEALADAGLNRLAQRIAGSLVDLLSGAIREARQKSEAGLKDLQERVSSLSAVADNFPALADELKSLRKQTDTFSEAERNLSFKLARLEVAMKAHEEGHQRIEEELRSVSAAQEEIRQTLLSHTGVLSGLEKSAVQLELALKAQQESVEQSSAASAGGLTQLGDRLSSLEANLAGQAQAVQEIREALGRLDDSQKALVDRVDKQAGVIRSLHAAAAAQAERQEEFRTALQKLEELAAGPDQPPALPDGL